MSFMEEPEEEKAEEEKTPDYTGVIIFVALLPLFFIFDHFGKANMGLNVCICLGVNLIAIRMRWDLRHHVWFWVVMVLVVAFELPLVLNIPWPHRWVPGIALLPIGFATFVIATGAIRLVEKFVVKTASSDEKD